MPRSYWLVKNEPKECSFEDLKKRPRSTGTWRGVRNYQARNFIRAMRKGDHAFYYHSNCEDPGVAGIVEIVSAAYPDPSQFDKSHKYYDPASSPEDPRWSSFDVKWKAKLDHVGLQELKANPRLEAMKVVQRGQRLSIQPVTEDEWREVCRMGGLPAPPQ